jgi:hypothetical protein
MFQGKLRIQWKTPAQLVRIITERLRRAQRRTAAIAFAASPTGRLRRDIDGPNIRTDALLSFR